MNEIIRDELIEELRQTMKDAGLSMAATSVYLDCSWISIQRWLKGKLAPSSISKRRIREGLVKIREAFPNVESDYSLALRGRTLWQKIKHKMTLEERAGLFDINQNKGAKAYIERLEELVKKYQPDKKQGQMLVTGSEDKK